MKINVLYEDNHLIAVYKPAGVLIQGDKTGDVSLLEEVKSYLKNKYKKSGNVFLGLLHRLDRPVSGIVLFAKTSKGASRLSAQFRNHQVKKTYQAIVIGKMNESRGVLVDYIKKDASKRKAAAVKNGSGKRAELFYKILASNDKLSLLEIHIKTGKFHQIRAQLALSGHPILGDVKYGAPFGPKDKSVALSATSISFKTATTDEQKEVSVKIPSNWDSLLRECL